MFVVSKMMSFCACTLLLISSFTVAAHDGHKNEDFIISDLGELGVVNFSISCPDKAKESVNIGVGLLHHMMYAQAEQHFLKLIDQKNQCAMVYWGYAMSLFHPLWPDTISQEAFKRGEKAILMAQSLTTKELANSKDRAFIDAAAEYFLTNQGKSDKAKTQAWANAQHRIYRQYPDDIDALAFYALSQLATAPANDPEFTMQKRMGELLTSKLDKYPTHPGLIHYSIHAFDNSKLANSGAFVAQAYDKIAPDVPHALHMPSHIFVRLGMWEDVISWNIRSASAALKYPTKNATSMHYVHALDYLIYGYMQTGNSQGAEDAAALISKHHPIENTFPAAYALSAIPARISLESKLWLKASQLNIQSPDYFDWQKFPQIEAITYFARGVGAARMKNFKEAENNLKVLNSLYDKTLKISPNYWAKLVDAQRQAVKAWILYNQGQKNKGLEMLSFAADLEDSLDKNPVTPGAVLPARELLADMFMLNNNFAQAITEYKKTLAINPNRLNSVNGIRNAKANMAE